MITGKEKFLD